MKENGCVPLHRFTIREGPRQPLGRLIDWLVDWLWWVETDISEPQPSLAYCSSPGWAGNREDDDSTPDLSTRARWQSYQQRHLERVGGMDDEMRISRIQYLTVRYANVSLTCRKILRHGTYGFALHLKEGVLWIFIALKNPSPRPGLKPRPLGPVATTLTTTPPRRQPLGRR
jgi:hypothetical protein